MSTLSQPASSPPPSAIVPHPRHLRRGAGRCATADGLAVTAPAAAAPAVARLRAGLAEHGVTVATSAGDAPGAGVVVKLVESDTPSPEAYALHIGPTEVRLAARTAAGWGHGVQTLLDLFDPAAGDWPVAEIDDAPHYAWRGLLLDCCRHFVSKETILRLLEQMAACKLNRLHWHLTDDQAWRLEIRRYPRLTAIGARRADEAGGEPQFYTQAEVREVVARAAELGIEVMPEIEMPGHATSVLAVYPELGCHRDPVEVRAAWGVFPHNYNAGDDRVFTFLEEVLAEVVELFPFPYVHLGADECQKDQWRECPDCQRRIQEEGLADEDALQSWFINRIAAFLRGHGRTAVGWDEILEGDPRPDMLVQAWRDERIIKLGTSRGYPVIGSPRRFCYFDLAVSQVDLRDVFQFDPAAGLDAAAARKVLGGEATMWTEYVEEADLEHMLFPRLWALSEALWCGPRAEAQFAEFKTRVDAVSQREQARGLRPGPALRDEISPAEMKGRTDLDEAPLGVDKLA